MLLCMPLIANAASVDDLTFDAATGTITDCNRDAEGELVIPSEIDGVKVTSIGDRAFGGCALTNITIPGSVTSIGYQAFLNCDLISINIPNGVTSIDRWAFARCENLINANISGSVTSIGEYAFGSCGSLNITVSPNNQNYCDIDGVLFTKDTRTLITYSKDKLQPEYIIPNGVTSIGDSAFDNCRSLTSVKLPDGVTSIGFEAFRECKSLTSISIPDSVTSIGDYAFQDTNLTSVKLSNSMTSIGGYVFNSCGNLTNITIPDSVTSIGWGAFEDCVSLTDVYYSGSERKWNLIVISPYNNGLENATIHYGGYDPITLAALAVTQSGDSYVLTAETDYDGDAYAASYDAEGALISVVSEPFADGAATVAPDTASAAKIKFFVWTNTVQPITLAKEITLI